MSNNLLVLDIETIPCQDRSKVQHLIDNAKPPVNYKKPESIEKWRRENADAIVEKTAYDGAYGYIACIGMRAGVHPVRYSAHTVHEERSMLANMSAALDALTDGMMTSPVVVGHNINCFDIPFLWKRAAILGVKLPSWFPRNLKPWSDETFDTMQRWDSKNYISLDNLARAFGIQGKSGVDGSMVHEMWKAGKHQEIAEYCLDDCRITHEIATRMMAAGL